MTGPTLIYIVRQMTALARRDATPYIFILIKVKSVAALSACVRSGSATALGTSSPARILTMPVHQKSNIANGVDTARVTAMVAMDAAISGQGGVSVP